MGEYKTRNRRSVMVKKTWRRIGHDEKEGKEGRTIGERR